MAIVVTAGSSHLRPTITTASPFSSSSRHPRLSEKRRLAARVVLPPSQTPSLSSKRKVVVPRRRQRRHEVGLSLSDLVCLPISIPLSSHALYRDLDRGISISSPSSQPPRPHVSGRRGGTTGRASTSTRGSASLGRLPHPTLPRYMNPCSLCHITLRFACTVLIYHICACSVVFLLKRCQHHVHSWRKALIQPARHKVCFHIIPYP